MAPGGCHENKCLQQEMMTADSRTSQEVFLHKKEVALHEFFNQDRPFLYRIRWWYLSHILGEQNAVLSKEASGEGENLAR